MGWSRPGGSNPPPPVQAPHALCLIDGGKGFEESLAVMARIGLNERFDGIGRIKCCPVAHTSECYSSSDRQMIHKKKYVQPKPHSYHEPTPKQKHTDCHHPFSLHQTSIHLPPPSKCTTGLKSFLVPPTGIMAAQTPS